MVRCSTDGGIFRIVNRHRRQFSPATYAAWRFPRFTALVDCSALYALCPPGPNVPMPKKFLTKHARPPVPQPAGPCPFANGAVVRCDLTLAIYRIEVGSL